MANYHYKIINSAGKKSSGCLEASCDKEARELLRAQGSHLLHLHKKKNSQIHVWSTIDRLNFTMHLTQLLNAGLPVYESLMALEEHSRGEKWHGMLIGLGDRVKAGASLSQAMIAYPANFDALYLAMIASGEMSGSLSIVCAKLADLMQKQLKLRKQLLTALIYPGLLAAISFIVISLLLLYVVPSLDALFENRPVGGITQAVLGVSRFLSHYWLQMIWSGLFCIALIYWKVKTPQGRRILYRFYLNIPFLKQILIQAALTRFTEAMHALLKSGVNLIDALNMARRVTSSPPLERVIDRLQQAILEGGRLSVELKKAPLIPSMVSRMVAIGEESGNLSGMFQKIAEIYGEEVEKRLTRMTTLAQPIILIVMGGIVGLIMLAVLLPLTDASAFIYSS